LGSGSAVASGQLSAVPSIDTPRISPTIRRDAVIHSTLALSLWSRSRLKRAFDLAFILCSLPFTLPLLILTAAAVRFTSHGPVLFRQVRTGWAGRAFTICKFRTMPVAAPASMRPSITTTANQSFTPVGLFLRRWKLDELPQLFNVLRGEMSLVGPRPKLPRLHSGRLPCRPGITGRASLIFAREEIALSALPASRVDTFYCSVIRPLKQNLDDDYMAKATFASDLGLILRSVFRRWGDAEFSALVPSLTRHPIVH
jgi:lipopolysaccharide/colanic/teichoic acid biosynthesis glycosyltransferase